MSHPSASLTKAAPCSIFSLSLWVPRTVPHLQAELNWPPALCRCAFWLVFAFEALCCLFTSFFPLCDHSPCLFHPPWNRKCFFRITSTFKCSSSSLITRLFSAGNPKPKTPSYFILFYVISFSFHLSSITSVPGSILCRHSLRLMTNVISTVSCPHDLPGWLILSSIVSPKHFFSCLF